MAGQFLTVTCRDCGTETVIFDRSVNHLLRRLRGDPQPPLWRKRTSWAAASLRPMSEGGPHMARITATDGPQEGDLVVATVTTVKQTAATFRWTSLTAVRASSSSVKSPAVGCATSAPLFAKGSA